MSEYRAHIGAFVWKSRRQVGRSQNELFRIVFIVVVVINAYQSDLTSSVSNKLLFGRRYDFINIFGRFTDVCDFLFKLAIFDNESLSSVPHSTTTKKFKKILISINSSRLESKSTWDETLKSREKVIIRKLQRGRNKKKKTKTMFESILRGESRFKPNYKTHVEGNDFNILLLFLCIHSYVFHYYCIQILNNLYKHKKLKV